MLPGLVTACEKLENIIEEAKAKVVTADDVPENMFRPAIAVYKDLYETMDVKTTEAYEKKLMSCYETDVQDIISKLRSLEVEWDDIVRSLDPEEEENETKILYEGDRLAGSVELINTKSEAKTDLDSLISSSDSTYLHLVLLRYLS